MNIVGCSKKQRKKEGNRCMLCVAQRKKEKKKERNDANWVKRKKRKNTSEHCSVSGHLVLRSSVNMTDLKVACCKLFRSFRPN